MNIWMQNYNPLNNILLSALIASIPILFFLAGLTLLKLKGLTAAAGTLIIAILVSMFLFDMPVIKILWTALYGILNGLWPIGYIILMAVWLYEISVKTGKFSVIRSSIAGISPDQRLQLLLIGFCFNAFLEGAAGFGVPIAICAALLTELGFKPLYAASLCLIANAASGAFGAIGIPVIVGAQVGGTTPLELSRQLTYVLPFISFIVPFLLVFIVDRMKGIRETLPALLVVSLSYTFVQLLTIITIGPELANIFPSLISLAALTLFLRYWQPKHIFRFQDCQELPKTEQKYSIGEIMNAWSPFFILTAFITIWSLPFFKSLFAAGQSLGKTVLSFPIPTLHQQVIRIPPITATESPYEAIYKLDLLSATGTAILISVIITIILSKGFTFDQGFKVLKGVLQKFTTPILTICFILGFAYVANFSGMSSTIGLALAKTEHLFPLFSPVLGWIGVFLTGSVVSNNALFGNLQAVTGEQIGVSSKLLIAANTSGGVMGKLISPQSIAIATATVKQSGEESTLFGMTLKYSLLLLLIVSLMTYLVAV